MYRPQDFPFPRARGRRALELKPDGQLVEYDYGITDVPRAIPGRWRVVEAGALRVELDDPRRPSYTLEIVACDEDRLAVRIVR